MRTRRPNRSWQQTALALSFLALTGITAHAQDPPRYRLLDVVVFHASLPVDASVYSPEVRTQLQQHIKRSASYRPRPRPAPDPKFREMNMVYGARELYERRMFAAAARPGAEAVAQRYVDELRPCYEWEGFHDCPEHEAQFAEQYLAKNPNGPFSEFLPLLIANRWLCAAEGYELEEQPTEAARARLAAVAPLAIALKSQSLLIRTAAQEQKARGRCNPDAR